MFDESAFWKEPFSMDANNHGSGRQCFEVITVFYDFTIQTTLDYSLD